MIHIHNSVKGFLPPFENYEPCSGNTLQGYTNRINGGIKRHDE